MHKEFIDVLLPWVSKIVHDASSTLVPTPKKGAQLNKANAMRNPNNQQSKLLSLDQLSNLFECLLALLKEPEPPNTEDNNTADFMMTANELVTGNSNQSIGIGRALEKYQRAEVLRIYQLIEKRL